MARAKNPFKLPPGVFRGSSPAESQDRWFDASLVRWTNGKLKPIGGALDYGFTLASPVRRVFSWADNVGFIRTALLCEQHLYVIENGVLLNISPTTPIAPPNSLAATGGYGNGLYGGDGTYGTERTGAPDNLATGNAYTLSNWGETLLAMTSSDGRLLQWDPTDLGSFAAAVDGAPVNNRTFAVTPEEYVILFGSGGDPRHWQWCQRTNINDWDITELEGTAGEYFVEPSAVILAATPCTQGTLFFTNTAAYLVRYAALPYVYVYQKIADQTTPVSAQAIAVYGDSVMWIDESGVWIWDGSQAGIIPCDLFNWWKENRNFNYSRDAAWAVNLGRFPEIFIFFPSQNSTVCDKYLMYNYLEKWWVNGSLKRSAGFIASYSRSPIMADRTRVFQHEFGTEFPDDENVAFAKTGAINIGNGATTTLTQVLVDNNDSSENSPIYVVDGYYTRIDDQDQLPDETTGEMLSNGGYLDAILSGRDIQITVKSPDRHSNSWSFGNPLFDTKTRGNR